MAWAVANGRVEPKGHAIIITKGASGSATIDLSMPRSMPFALMSTNPWSSRDDIAFHAH
jgi:phage terminase large subunit-like protein